MSLVFVACAARIDVPATQVPVVGPSQTPLPTQARTPAQAPTPALTPGSAVPPTSGSPPPELVRIPLSGDGPIDVEIIADEAWVLASDSAELIRVDLTTQQEIDAQPAGSLPTVLTIGHDGQALIGDIGASNGEHLLVLDPATGEIQRLQTTDEVASITTLGVNLVWVLETSGRLDHFDIPPGQVAYAASVQVTANQHMEVVADDDSLWASSDSGPVSRVLAVRAQFDQTLDVGGGVPFLFHDGLVWGARPDELWSIDSATLTKKDAIPLADLIEVLAVDIDGTNAWITGRHPGYVGTVLRLDMTSAEVTGEWPVSLPASVKVHGDYAWVTSYDTDELIGIPL